jgi:hypothetical protein
MNKKQLIVMWVGIAIIILMGIFPPWIVTVQGTDNILGHAFILSRTGRKYDINASFLFVQWIMVVAITGGLIITFKDKKPNDEQKE